MGNFIFCAVTGVNFNNYCQILIFGKEAGHYTLSSTTIDSFLIIPNFVKFYVLSPSPTCKTIREQ